jgi:hypothetical protein
MTIIQRCTLQDNKNIVKRELSTLWHTDTKLDDTKIIKLDEPTVGLNPSQIIGVKEILLKNKGSE